MSDVMRSAPPARRWVVLSIVALSLASLGVYYVATRAPKTQQKKKKRRASTAADEEPRETATAITTSTTTVVTETTVIESDDKTPNNAMNDTVLPVPLITEYNQLSDSAKYDMAAQLKNKGNDLFKIGHYQEAIESYGKAIALQPKNAVFWCNRAACYANLNDYENVITDCTWALEYDSMYVKALHRRALAYEHLGRLTDALNDFTTICVIEGFKNQPALISSEKLLKTIAETKAKSMLTDKKPSLPSPTFVSAYLEAFRKMPSADPGSLDHTSQTARYYFNLSKDHVAKRRFNEALTACERALDLLPTSQLTSVEEGELYNLHGTFLFLEGQVSDAVLAFDKALEKDSNNVNTLIKRSNVFMEQGDAVATLGAFEAAITVNDRDPDVYYHRGQVQFLRGAFNEAISDYQRSIELDANFVFAFIQLGVAQYKVGQLQRGFATFKKAMTHFPNSFDLYNYYGELLMDQQRFTEALENFDKSLSLSPASPLPYINKALLLYQSQGDLEQAERLMKQAISKDDRCDIAYVQLANFLLHQGRVEEAAQNFDRAIELARTEAELINAISAKESSMAQYHVTTVLSPSVIAEGLK